MKKKKKSGNGIFIKEKAMGKKKKSGNGLFSLGDVSGKIDVGKGIWGLSHKSVIPECFEFRKTDPYQSLLAVIRGKDGRCYSLSFGHFSQHPPEDGLRHLAVQF